MIAVARRPRRPGSRGPRLRRTAARLVMNLLAAVFLVVMVFPVYWMVATAFKPGRDILRLTPKFVPSPATLVNFRDAIQRAYFLDDVRNSVVIVVGTVTIALAVAFLAAVALARLDFRGKLTLIVLFVGVQMVPLNALIIPIYLLLDAANQTDTLAGVIVTYLAFVLPFVVWTLRGFVANVPVELEEAAMIDGCTRAGAFWRILFPLVAPGLVATAVFAFVQAWNEFIIAYVLLRSPQNQTLMVWLASFTTERGTDWGSLMAGATMTSIPVVVFFLIVQRRIVTNLTAGAVKG